MKTPNTIEDDIDRIRLKIYEETKDMSPDQRAEHTNRKAEAFIKRMGYRYIVGADKKRLLVKIQEGELSNV